MPPKALKKRSNLKPPTLRTKQCSVVVEDLLPTLANKVKSLESEIADLRVQLSVAESLSQKLLPLSYLITPPTTPDPVTLELAGSLITSITTEVQDRINRANNVIVFNVSNRVSLDIFKRDFLQLYGIRLDCATCTKLNHSRPRGTSPVLFHFVDKAMAQHVLRHKSLLTQSGKFSKIVIKPDQTAMQRQFRVRANENQDKTPRVQPPSMANNTGSSPTQTEHTQVTFVGDLIDLESCEGEQQQQSTMPPESTAEPQSNKTKKASPVKPKRFTFKRLSNQGLLPLPNNRPPNPTFLSTVPPQARGNLGPNIPLHLPLPQWMGQNVCPTMAHNYLPYQVSSAPFNYYAAPIHSIPTAQPLDPYLYQGFYRSNHCPIIS